jgi:hypothetical protein
MGQHSAYGVQVMRTPLGSYYWDAEMADVSFLPWRKRIRRDFRDLRHPEDVRTVPHRHPNTLEGAVMCASQMSTQHARSLAAGDDPAEWETRR